MLVNLRQVALSFEVRVAGAPSNYPNSFAFPKDWRDGSRVPLTIPSQAILGFHKFESGDLDHITEEGRSLGGGSDLWCYDNALNLPESCPPCELRALRLPAGIASSGCTWRTS